MNNKTGEEKEEISPTVEPQQEVEADKNSSPPPVADSSLNPPASSSKNNQNAEEAEDEEIKPLPQGPGNEEQKPASKKISAKEYVQHVKNLKRRIAELEEQAATALATATTTRADAPKSNFGQVFFKLFQSRLRAQQLTRAFHHWHAFALQHAANVQVEKMAQLANRANQDLESAKAQANQLAQERAQQDQVVRKLKVLLQKAKQQVVEISTRAEHAPNKDFTLKQVVRKLVTPSGECFCLIQIEPNRFEFRPEQIVSTWLEDAESRAKLANKLGMEEEFAERYRALQAEMELKVATISAQLESEQAEFQQFKMRAELAFERQQCEDHGSASAQQSANLERELAIVSQELVNVAAERDAGALALHELRHRMAELEAFQAQAKVREQSLKQACDAMEAQVLAAQRNTAAASQQFADKLDEALQRQAEEMDQERELRRKQQLELESSARLVKELELRHANEQVALERKHEDAVALLQDRIRVLESATRLPRHNINTTTASSVEESATPRMSQLPLPPPSTTHSFASRSFSERRDSLDSFEDGGSIVSDAQHSQPGSKYFVDQMGALRAQVRNERAEWQRERAQFKQQMEDSVRRKEDVEQRLAALERQLHEQTLAEQRNQLLLGANTSGNAGDGLVYLKNCVFRFITAEDDSERETLLPVITTLLKFNPEEVKALSLETDGKRNNTGSGGLLSGLLRW